ncbi:MAG: hypothetical protein OXG83_15475 [Acidobacteria bacterium]|nr:hypothetical protein [Acidobacteriota bacterium]
MALNAPDVPHLAGRHAALRELGFRPHEAAWLALVCLHSGVFTRTQFTDHHQCSPATARTFARSLVAAGVAREHPLPNIDTRLHYTHVHGRSLYRALGIENVRHRRAAEDVVLFRRLLSLDHVIRHPDLPWLASEQEKVAHFTGRGVRRDQLPSRRYGGPKKRTVRYFALKLPIAADEQSATFVYIDPGRQTDRELQGWAAEHRPLWSGLRALGTEVRVAAVARTVAKQHELSHKVAAWTNDTPAAGQPLTPEERQTLADLRAALLAADPAGFDQWGGFEPARQLSIHLRQRAEAEDSGLASAPVIDAYSSHHARGLSPQGLA